MKALYTITIAVFLAACSLTPKEPVPVRNSYDSQGRLVQSSTELTQEQYINSQIVTAKGGCQIKYYSAVDKASNATEAALITGIQGLTLAAGVDPCANVATSNDVEIVKSNNFHASVQSFIEKIPLIGGMTAAAIVGRKAVQNRDPVVVEQPQPLVVDPVIVNPEVITVPSGD